MSICVVNSRICVVLARLQEIMLFARVMHPCHCDLHTLPLLRNAPCSHCAAEVYTQRCSYVCSNDLPAPPNTITQCFNACVSRLNTVCEYTHTICWSTSSAAALCFVRPSPPCARSPGGKSCGSSPSLAGTKSLTAWSPLKAWASLSAH